MSSSVDVAPRNSRREITHQPRPRVLVTGANGLIGGFVMKAWRAPGSRFDAVGLARSAGPNADIIADIGDLDALVAGCDGVDAIVHLAATSAVDSPWEAVLESNLIGTYNVFEAARRAGVPRVVFPPRTTPSAPTSCRRHRRCTTSTMTGSTTTPPRSGPTPSTGSPRSTARRLAGTTSISTGYR